MIALDSNVLYVASRDCRYALDYERCVRRKKLANEILEFGKVHGCVIPYTVKEEVKRTIIEEYAPFCKIERIEDNKNKEFVEKFIDRLIAIANKDEKFLVTCTPEARDKYTRISKAMKGDWRIVAETIARGETLVSFDKNMYHPYCKAVYRKVASELGVDANDWDAFHPREFLELVKEEKEKLKEELKK